MESIRSSTQKNPAYNTPSSLLINEKTIANKKHRAQNFNNFFKIKNTQLKKIIPSISNIVMQILSL